MGIDLIAKFVQEHKSKLALDGQEVISGSEVSKLLQQVFTILNQTQKLYGTKVRVFPGNVQFVAKRKASDQEEEKNGGAV